ncbi:hypothetical protein QM012_003646 [Aureobasidium pullulans]|uniref:BTB domain-containing protein n=1 Tax=Aureobasidium pullulans TaxID=5580 RepID=A0ABR0T8N7_AURPU
MTTELTIFNSMLPQIPSMGKTFSNTAQDEHVDERALVTHQHSFNRPNDHVDMAIDQNDSAGSASPLEEPSNMNNIQTLEDVSAFRSSHDERPLILSQSTPPNIAVIVEGKSTMIPKHLLCAQSSFFERALNGSFREAHNNRIILEECYEVFQIFHTWLMKGKLEFVEPNSNASVDDHVEQRQLALLEIYVFADRLGIPKLSDQALPQLDKLLRPSGRPGRASADCITMPPNSFPKALVCEPLSLSALSKQVCEYGGYRRVEQLRKWGVICLKMGISLSFQSRIFLQVRELYAYWLGPFDEQFTSEEGLVLEKRCSRPFVKQFFQSPVASTLDALARLDVRSSGDL